MIHDEMKRTHLVKFMFSLLLDRADVTHRQPIPQVRPAEHLPVKVCEYTSLALHHNRTLVSESL